MHRKVTCIFNVSSPDHSLTGVKNEWFNAIICSELGAVHGCYVKEICKNFKELSLSDQLYFWPNTNQTSLVRSMKYSDCLVPMNDQTNLCHSSYILHSWKACLLVKETLQYLSSQLKMDASLIGGLYWIYKNDWCRNSDFGQASCIVKNCYGRLDCKTCRTLTSDRCSVSNYYRTERVVPTRAFGCFRFYSTSSSVDQLKYTHVNLLSILSNGNGHLRYCKNYTRVIPQVWDRVA